jgi:beta-lactamase class A
MTRILTLALALTSLVYSCSNKQTAVGSRQTAGGEQAAVGSRRTAGDQALQTQIEEIAADAKGRVGVSVMILETGETIVSLDPGGHFPMQSVYKLPISMAVMKQVDAGKLRLDQKVRIERQDYVGRAAHSPIRDQNPQGTELTVSELLRFALSESDGTASDVLMKLTGGPQAVQAYLTELSIKDMIVLDTENAFTQDHSLQYRNYATPEAAVSLLRALTPSPQPKAALPHPSLKLRSLTPALSQREREKTPEGEGENPKGRGSLHEPRGLSESSQALLLKFMIESKPGAKRLKGLLPNGTIVAHKTGTSGTEKGVTAATNDIGIVTLPSGKHLAIAVFVSDSPADEATREGVIARIAKAVFDAVNGK